MAIKQYIKIRAAVANLLQVTARKPYRAFLLLLVIFALFAAYIYFGPGDSGSAPDSQIVIPQKAVFNSAKAKEYRAVFETIRQRRENYDRAASSVYPDAFGTAQTPKPAAGLTESQN